MQLSDRDRELLLQTFFAEAGENLTRMEEALVALERRPDDLELVHELFRLAHSLKGDARMTGFPHVAEFAHGVEDALARLRDREAPVTAELVTRLLQTVDVLRGMTAAAAAGREPSRSEDAHARTALGEALAHARAGVAPAATRDPADAAPADAHASATAARTLRVDVAKLDRMLDLTGEIAIAQGRVLQLLEALPGGSGGAAHEAFLEAVRLQLALQEEVMDARMVPVAPFFRQYTRTVRDLAAASGKQVTLVVEGDEVEVDTRVLEALRDPVTHMVRNAVDHGLESPDLRVALGKPAEGRITLRAAQEGGQIVVQMSDDGAGIDRQRVAARARAMGLAAAPEQLADEALLELVFAPGFTTTDTVTELSGRGVGMDVVRRNIEALRGTVSLTSEPDHGTTISIRLPLTLAIIEGFSVGVGEETYVLPLEAVHECMALPPSARDDGAGGGLLSLRGEALPYLHVRNLFGLEGAAPARAHVVVVGHGGRRAGLVVDLLHGERQAVIKSLGATFAGLSGVAGSTILGDGRVALILDVTQLLHQAYAAHGSRAN